MALTVVALKVGASRPAHLPPSNHRGGQRGPDARGLIGSRRPRHPTAACCFSICRPGDRPPIHCTRTLRLNTHQTSPTGLPALIRLTRLTFGAAGAAALSTRSTAGRRGWRSARCPGLDGLTPALARATGAAVPGEQAQLRLAARAAPAGVRQRSGEHWRRAQQLCVRGGTWSWRRRFLTENDCISAMT